MTPVSSRIRSMIVDFFARAAGFPPRATAIVTSSSRSFDSSAERSSWFAIVILSLSSGVPTGRTMNAKNSREGFRRKCLSANGGIGDAECAAGPPDGGEMTRRGS